MRIKGRRYVSDPSEVPEGYEPQEGPQGGIFYEPGGGEEGEEPPTVEDIVQNIEAFDEDDFEYGDWRSVNWSNIEEGTMVDAIDLNTFGSERAQVVNIEDEDHVFAVTEDGDIVNLRGGEWSVDEYFDPMEWKDPEYESEPAEDAPEEEGEKRPYWANEDPFEDITESAAPEGGLQEGELYHHDGDIVRLERDEDYEGDVPVYEVEHFEYSEIDGVLCRAGNPNDVNEGEVQYFDFSDAAGVPDGWYQVGDLEQVDEDDPNSLGWELWNEEQGTVQVLASDVHDTVHSVHRPRENSYRMPDLEATPEPSGSTDPDDWSIDWDETDETKTGNVLPMGQKKLLMREWEASVDPEAAESVSDTIRSVKDGTYSTAGQKYDKLMKAVMGVEGEPRSGDFEDAGDVTEEEIEAMRVLQDASQKFFETHYGESTDIHRGLADYSHENLLSAIGERFAEGGELSGQELQLNDNPAGVWTTQESAARTFTIVGGTSKSLMVSDQATKDDVFNMPDAIYPYEQREERASEDSDWDEGEINVPSYGKVLNTDEVMVVNAMEEDVPQAPLSAVLDEPLTVMENGDAGAIARFVKTLSDLAPEEFYDAYLERLQSNEAIMNHEDYEKIEEQIRVIEYDPNASIFDAAQKADGGRIVLDVRREEESNWLNATSEYMESQAKKASIAKQLVDKARRYIQDPSEAPEDATVEEGPQGGLYYETGEESVEAPADEDLWVNNEGVWRSMERYEHLSPGMLADYLSDPPQEATDFLHDREFADVLNDAEAGKRWNEMVRNMDTREAVSFLFMTAVEGEERHPRMSLPSAANRNSDFGDHGPYAAVIKQMDDQTVDHLLKWVKSTDSEDNLALKEIKNAIARHGPFNVRRKELQRARSEPYIGPDKEYYPDEDFYDRDADWLAEDADDQTFRDHLINHWTDSATSQGGIIAREAAFSLALNPIWETIDEPYHGYNNVAVPYENTPGHIMTKFDQLRRETEKFYRDQGVDSVTLYRGVDQDVTTAAPLESWTDSPEEAERYAGEGGTVMEKEVPVEHIVFSHESYDDERWNAIAGWKGGSVEQGEGLREFAVLGGSEL